MAGSVCGVLITMCRGKVIGLSISLLSPRKSPYLNIQEPKQLVSITDQSKSAANWLECISNRLAWSMNVTNSILCWPSWPCPLIMPTTYHALAGQLLLLMRPTGLVEIINITGLSLRRRLQMLGTRGMCSIEFQFQLFSQINWQSQQFSSMEVSTSVVNMRVDPTLMRGLAWPETTWKHRSDTHPANGVDSCSLCQFTQQIWLITLHTCTRGKATGLYVCLVVSMKIVSLDLGI